MRNFRLLDPSHCPREGFPYTDPDTGYESRGKTLAAVIANARIHREANGLPVAENFAQLVETQICRLDPEQCVSLDGAPQDTTCAHRGAEIRREGCPTCGGVQAKILACAIHGECTQFKHDVKVQRCGLCPDRVSTLTPEEK